MTPTLIHDTLLASAQARPQATALRYRGQQLDYAGLAAGVEQVAAALLALGLGPGERVAVYLEKRMETVLALFGAAAAGLVFVPINPLLKPAQVSHILQDCSVRVLVTSEPRHPALADRLSQCPALQTVVLVDAAAAPPAPPAPLGRLATLDWSAFLQAAPGPGSWRAHRRIDADIAAILYTSGSTGQPKGVVLSHRNLVAGAQSVAGYLGNHPQDRLLAVLPLSFDYGLSQLSTAFLSGASVTLLNYLAPRDILHAVASEGITGLAGVPPLWQQLAGLPWPQGCSLRYLTNSGGALPRSVLAQLRRALPQAQVFLMYGLTEAFRSTYLPPAELDRRPDSIGRAIPNAEIMVVRPDGSPCAPGEVGELVHRGALVAQGYWNDPARTAERFRPAPGREAALGTPELAVWSGDSVRMDEQGYLYFVGRADDMIKVSGYRISPHEVEEVLHATGLADEFAVVGVAHPQQGQAVVAVAPSSCTASLEAVQQACRAHLPSYMLPAALHRWPGELPRSPNGKLDRKLMQQTLADHFMKADHAR
ncbi:acyl-CoA ligase (AMP-forming), exosortase A system-associated [Herbaspirillum seropedicae]|uniref:acyl-CoA ligase (AMP-forming), exosortase A system-associated n=1 Tax=Herbaspirillum seropedicae TaxID=964 RepID=UPI0028640702|nr:acyl-CoA ligase (AMP-forming), exosortase A system-associated [Herbaspirillum seropedicae]MDR6393885.1 acyl-CoA ligase (AMP-forming) (exosortase A-associated) [Herbaspirillum seropedicae]